MKRLLFSLFTLGLLLSLTGCASVDPKVMACRAGCDEACKDCMEKAGDSEVKKAACQAAKEKCYSECSK